jgi:hypothetical protein
MLRPLPHPRAAPGEEEIDRVVCASLASDTTAVYVQMERIRSSSLRHNGAGHVRAVLVYQSGWFLHWFEGPAAEVRELLDRLGADTRHKELRVLHRSRGRRFLPTAWSMMLSGSPEPAALFGKRVEDLHRQFQAGTQYAPTSVLRRLATPVRIVGQQGPADPEAFHRICAVASGNEAFDLVRWLARQHRAGVTTKRVAGESGHDSGSDYVEWMLGEHPCRVIAVARTALLHGLARVFMPDWPHLLLLFSGDERRDDALMDRVRLACHHLPQPPELVGVAPDVASQQRMAHAAHADGLSYHNAGLMAPQDSAAVWHVMEDLLQRFGPPPSSAWAVEDAAAWR